MVGSVAPIPPNPEDGEFWLPSDIFLEISSISVEPQTTTTRKKKKKKKNKNIIHFTPPSFTPFSPLASDPPEMKVYDTFLGLKTDGKATAISPRHHFPILNHDLGCYPPWNNAISPKHHFPILDHDDLGYYPLCNNGFHGISPTGKPFNPFDSPIPPQTQFQGLGINYPKARYFTVKSKGTGVFLPKLVNSSPVKQSGNLEEAAGGKASGTGVSLNNQVKDEKMGFKRKRKRKRIAR